MGNRKLARANALNRALFRRFSIEEVEGDTRRFILSSTRLTRDEYGDAPAPFLRRLGIAKGEWERVGELFLLRAVVLSPEFAGSGLAAEFRGAFSGALAEAMGRK